MLLTAAIVSLINKFLRKMCATESQKGTHKSPEEQNPYGVYAAEWHKVPKIPQETISLRE